MAKDPAFLFYTSDFYSGISDLTMEERGQFITLLCLQHLKGHLSGKAVALAVGKPSEDVMAKFAQDENGLYFNERLEVEIEKRRNFSLKQSERAKKRHRQKSGTDSGTPAAPATAVPYENVNVNEDVNENIDEAEIEVWPTFENFWDAYDKKRDRPKCEKLWAKLKQSDREAIMDYIPNYKLSQPDKAYRKDPATFLRNRSWENELIISPELRKHVKSELMNKEFKNL